jgi:hypothetical protein
LAAARSCEIDQNASHQLCANGKEMSPVLPFDLPDVHQPQIGLMDEGSSLESISGPFTCHAAACRRMQLLIDERHQLPQRFFVAPAPSLQKTSYFERGVSTHKLQRLFHLAAPRELSTAFVLSSTLLMWLSARISFASFC